MITIGGRDIVPGGTNAPSLYDIGYALSRVPRFCGHTKKPWSVLQHLFAAYLLAKYQGWTESIQLHALLHDAHEAIIGDIPNPWKTDDMRAYQHELDVRIYNNIGLSLPTESEKKIIKQIDTSLLYAEADAVGVFKELPPISVLAKKAVKRTSILIGDKYSPTEGGIFFESTVNHLLSIGILIEQKT